MTVTKLQLTAAKPNCCPKSHILPATESTSVKYACFRIYASYLYCNGQ